MQQAKWDLEDRCVHLCVMKARACVRVRVSCQCVCVRRGLAESKELAEPRLLRERNARRAAEAELRRATTYLEGNPLSLSVSLCLWVSLLCVSFVSFCVCARVRTGVLHAVALLWLRLCSTVGCCS